MSDSLSDQITFQLRDGKQVRPASLALVVDSGTEPNEQARYWLEPEEIEQGKRLLDPRARQGFFLSRSCAKRSLHALGIADIHRYRIDHGVFGYPVWAPQPQGWQISLAHAQNAAIALSYDRRDMLGVDLEVVTRENAEIIRSSLSEQEVQLALRDLGRDEVGLHLLWSAREALSKALRTGFLIPGWMFAVGSINETDETYELSFAHFDLFTVYAWQLGPYVLAIALPSKVYMEEDPLSDWIGRFKSSRANEVYSQSHNIHERRNAQLR